jgi:hypothetical protein
MQRLSDINGTITERTLNRLLKIRSGTGCDNAVPSPSAQSIPLCELGADLQAWERTAEDAINQLRHVSQSLAVFAITQHEYGLRVSEMLEIKGVDLMNGNRVKIRGLKHSNNRIIVSKLLHDHFKSCKGLNIRLFDSFSRWFIYREYKKVGLSMSVKSSSRNVVTHLFRHLAIKDLKAYNTDTEDSRNFIGHKNGANTQRYEA